MSSPCTAEARISEANNELQAEKQQLEASLAGLATELRLEKESREAIDSELQSARRQMSDTVSEMAKANSKLAEAEDKRKRLLQMLRSRKLMMIQAAGEHQVELNAMGQELDRAASDAAARADGLRREVGELQIINNKLESDAGLAAEKLLKAWQELQDEQSDNQALRRQVQRLEGDVATERDLRAKEAEEAKAAVQSQKTRSDNAVSWVESLEKVLADGREKLDSAKEAARGAELAHSLGEYIRMCEHLKGEVAQLESASRQVKQLGDEGTKLKEQVLSATASIQRSSEPKHTRQALHTQVAAVADVLAQRWIKLEDLAPPSNSVLDKVTKLLENNGQLSAAWSQTSKTLRIDRGDDTLLLIKDSEWESILVWHTGTKSIWFASPSCAERLFGVRIRLRAPMGQQPIVLKLADLEHMNFWFFCNWFI
ncbi:hypothetical protein LX36DRAFT_706910 [Colletotrichum falcatum]|nr:hypothetical protein LX36DRAFT_706910 [Colletotrichum falcatum]